MPDPFVSVVVPVRDAASDLQGLVKALRAQRGAPPFELVVADDGSSDDVSGAVAGAPFPVTVVRLRGPGGCTAASPADAGETHGALPAAPRGFGRRSPRSAGPGAARNAAVARARGALLAFTDADCRPAPGWLAAIWARSAGRSCVVQGPVLVPEGVAVGPFDRTVQRPAAGGLHETANLGVRRADVLAVGGFPAGVRPLGGKEMGEDVGLGCALRRRGLPVAWCPDAVVVHPVGGRGPLGAARERLRAGGFCVLTHRWPELRTTVLHRRAFLGPHRPALDLALLGAMVAAAGGGTTRGAAGRGTTRAVAGGGPTEAVPDRRATSRRRPVLALALALALPYLRGLDARSRGAGRRRQPAVAAGLVAGDLAETAGLVAGSLLTRTPIL